MNFFSLKHRAIFLWSIVGSIALFVLLMTLSTPSVKVFEVDGMRIEKQEFDLPFHKKATKEPMNIHLVLTLKKFQTTTLHFRGDDCIANLHINTVGIDVPTCESQIQAQGFTIDRSRSLRIGGNSITATIVDLRQGDQGIDVTFPLNGGLLMLLRILTVLLVGSLVLVYVVRWHGMNIPILCIVLLGLIVRYFYNDATYFEARAHDISGHIEYLRFVASHWSIPPGGGYEFHQAPLYYFFVAPFLFIAERFDWSLTQGILWIHQMSLIFSFLTVLSMVWCGTVLFERDTNPWKLRIFLLVALLVPRTVMLSGAITNDALILLPMTLTLGYLVRYWRNGNQRDWYWSLAMFCLSFLTKLNAIIFLPVFAILLLCEKNLSWTSHAKKIFLSLLLIIVFAGWLPLVRSLQSEYDMKNVVNFGKAGGNSQYLIIGSEAIRFVTFNPIGILQHPYNNPWSDDERRRNYWEYFLRSSLFGEFSFEKFRPFAPLLLTSLMVLIGYGLLAIDRTLKTERQRELPMLLTTLSLLAAAFTYAYVYPYASEQDFRVSLLLGVTLSYFVSRGIVESKGASRFLAIFALTWYVALCSWFFVIV